MKLKGLKLGILLCVITFSATAAGYVSGVRAWQKSLSDTSSGSSTSISSPQAEIPEEELLSAVSKESEFTQTYLIKEHEGRIALFMKYASGEEALHDVYDVSVSLLPSSDREQLQKGIYCDSLSDALQLVEDYSS